MTDSADELAISTQKPHRKITTMNNHLLRTSAPRAVQGRIYAQVGSSIPRAMAAAAAMRAPAIQAAAGDEDGGGYVRRLRAAFETFQSKYDSELDNVQRAMDDMNAKIAAGPISGWGGSVDADLQPPEPEYSKTFASYFRSGEGESDLRGLNATGRRAEIKAAMSVGTDNAGGYLAPIEWDRRINKALQPLSPMRRIANVQQTSVRAYQTLYLAGGWGSGWVGESASRPATSTPTMEPLIFPNGELYAFPMTTQQLLEDADFNVEQWLADEIEEEFAAQEAVAFLSGNGTNKPRGLLTYVAGGTSAGVHPGGDLVTVPTGSAATLGDPDKLIDFVYSLRSPYRQNARWLMNSLTAATLAKVKDGDGNYLWRETYVAGQPATLLGYPVEIDEGMPDIAAGALPIAFGDFQRGYVINDRLGSTILRDPYTAKPFVGFYVRKRVGGGVDDPKAIRLLRVAAS